MEPVDAKATNLRFEDSGTFGAKLTAWHLPKKYSWQPQIGFKIDWTRFTADVPAGQVLPAFGTFQTTGTPVGFAIVNVAPEFAVDNMMFNLLFRYPIGATPDMPQGRWYPYVGIGEAPNGLAYHYRAIKKPVRPLLFRHWEVSSSL